MDVVIGACKSEVEVSARASLNGFTKSEVVVLTWASQSLKFNKHLVRVKQGFQCRGFLISSAEFR